MNPSPVRPAAGPSPMRVLAAFLTVYLVWGSTYLAIKIAVESMPAFLMAGTRFIVAGAILYVFARLRGAPRPSAANWRACLLIGGLLLLGGNGGVVWSQSGNRVPSGLAALMVATVPLWMVLLDWLRPGGVRPTRGVVAGLTLGFAGLYLLVRPGDWGGAGAVDPWGALALTLASLSWSVGSVFSRNVKLPSSPLVTTALEMLCGGALLTLAALAHGDFAAVDASRFTMRSILALAYLILMGSLLGYTAYVWLLGVAPPARVATYAYVNPVVAVILGWLLNGEPLGLRTIAAAAVIVTGVVFITTSRRTPAKSTDAPPSSQPSAADAVLSVNASNLNAPAEAIEAEEPSESARTAAPVASCAK